MLLDEKDSIEHLIHIYGKTFDEWVELMRSKEAYDLDISEMARENVTLRAKISYYERRIDQMFRFMKANIEIKL
jgi:hypothetical protein